MYVCMYVCTHCFILYICILLYYIHMYYDTVGEFYAGVAFMGSTAFSLPQFAFHPEAAKCSQAPVFFSSWRSIGE